MTEKFDDIDDLDPTPEGDLSLQTVCMPADTNPNGNIFAGWLMSQMDLAGAIKAQEIARGSVTTVSSGNMVFLRPVPVGATISCHTKVLEVGRSSIQVEVEVWLRQPATQEFYKVTDGTFIFVAIDGNGNTRAIS